MWGTGMRKKPNLTSADIAACVPIGLMACVSHAGSVLAVSRMHVLMPSPITKRNHWLTERFFLSLLWCTHNKKLLHMKMGVGAVSFAQIVKACEPVFAAVVGMLIPPVDFKPILAYVMLIPIVGGVGIACIKEGKGVDINYTAFMWASIANLAAALKGKLGGSVTHSLKDDKSKNMDSANVYAVMNILSFLFTIPMVVVAELPTLSAEWDKAVAANGAQSVVLNIALSGFFFYLYNEFAFAFTASVGAVTSSVLNTAKRVIIIVVSSIVFVEPMERNTVVGSAIAILGTFAYSMAESSKKAAPKKKTA